MARILIDKTCYHRYHWQYLIMEKCKNDMRFVYAVGFVAKTAASSAVAVIMVVGADE